MPDKRKERFVALTVLKRALKTAGAVKVSAEAAEEFGLVIGELAEDVAKRSVELCNFRKGKMVLKGDVRQATR